MEEWITVKDAAQIRNCTERNILKLIDKGELKARKDGRRWLVLMDTAELQSEKSPNSTELISALKTQLQEKDSQINKLQAQIEQMQKGASEAGQRHDTIVLQLTRQLEQSQRLLEYKQEPFYRRWFKKRKTE